MMALKNVKELHPKLEKAILACIQAYKSDEVKAFIIENTESKETADAVREALIEVAFLAAKRANKYRARAREECRDCGLGLTEKEIIEEIVKSQKEIKQ